MNNIKSEIFNNAMELFRQNGFKETNVSDITKMTGIGVGSFYNYYSSKEEIFLKIFYYENKLLKKSIIDNIRLEDEPIKIFKEIITKLFDGMKTNPILKEWYNRDSFIKIQKKVDIHELRGELDDFSYNIFIGLIKEFQVIGRFRSDIDSDLILALFNSLSYIDLHKEEIGDLFPQVINHLIEYIVKGINQ